MDDKTLIDILNESSQELNQVDAADSENPSKTVMTTRVNKIQRKLCGLRDWEFLKRTVEINGYEVSATAAVAYGGFYRTSGATFTTTANASQTEFFAEKITTSTDYLSKMISVVLYLTAAGTGIGLPQITAQVLICPDSGGSPDLANPVLSSDIITGPVYTDAGASDGAANTFTFTTNDTVLLKNTGYWFVLKTVGAADNGDGLLISYDTTAASTTTKKRMYGAPGAVPTAFSAFTTGKMVLTFNYYQTDYITSIEIDDTFAEIYRIYTGDIADPDCNMLPYDSAHFEKSPSSMPTDRFAVLNYTSGGKRVIYIKPSVDNVLTMNVYGKIKVSDMVLDTDTPVIPSEFQDVLSDATTLYFVKLGYGQQDRPYKDELKEDVELLIQNMTRAYNPKGLESFVPRVGYKAGGNNPELDVVNDLDALTQDV
jgi:hypothetical protein